MNQPLTFHAISPFATPALQAEEDTAAYADELEAVRASVGALEQRLATAEAARAVLGSELDTLRKQLRAAYAKRDTEVAALKGQLAAAEAAAGEAATALEARLVELQGAAASAESAAAAEVAAARAELAAERELVARLRASAQQSEHQVRLAGGGHVCGFFFAG
jgi:hypothetical protein